MDRVYFSGRVISTGLALAILAVGCAVSPEPSRQLAQRAGAQIMTVPGGGRILREVTLTRPGTEAGADGVGLCLASNLRVDGVLLADSSGTYDRPYDPWWPYYPGFYDPWRERRSVQTLSGEEAVKYIASEGHESIARGQFGYAVESRPGKLLSSTSNYTVRFTLNLKQLQSGNQYRFSDIQIAVGDTGFTPNPGLRALPDNAVLQPERAYDGMAAIADKLNECLMQRSR